MTHPVFPTPNIKRTADFYVENLDFNATLSNNAILIFGTQNNAYIQIKNCHFSDVSNCVRLSNKINHLAHTSRTRLKDPNPFSNLTFGRVEYNKNNKIP